MVDDPEKKFHIAADGTRSDRGDPVNWIRLHGHTVYLCLELSDAIQASDAHRAGDLINGDLLRAGVMQLDKLVEGFRFKKSAFIRAMIQTPRTSPEKDEAPITLTRLDQARALRRHIINENITRISRQLRLIEDGSERSCFAGQGATIEAVYWHLANLVDGGTVKRCEAKGCGAVFIQTHGHQRFCPPRWRQRESPSALRERQRRR